MNHFNHIDIGNLLRYRYFKNKYMDFGIESGSYVLSFNSKKYEIIYETFKNYLDAFEYVETALKTKYPELFL